MVCGVIWICLEIAFWYVIEFVVVPRLQRLSKPSPVSADPIKFFVKILDAIDSLKGYSIQEYIEGFFHRSKLEDIYVENFRSFLAWAMFGKFREDLDEQDLFFLEKLEKELHRRYKVLQTLKPGYNPKIKHTSFTLEEIPHVHRPLLVYVAAGVTEMIFNAVFLRLKGFQRMGVRGLNYWYKQGPANDTSPPLLILHGISPGWSFYGMLVHYLSENRTVLLIDFDSIKIKSMHFHMPPIEEFTGNVKLVLKRHHIAKVSVVGHSFGSITAAWILTHHPEIVCHLCLIDPVSLLLSLPDVAYSFLYKAPTTWTEYLIHYAASREITISHMLYRHFCWHKNTLWLENIPTDIGVVVGMGSGDEIANMVVIEEYVNRCNIWRKTLKSTTSSFVAEISTVMWEGFSHGQVLLSPTPLKELNSIIKLSEKLNVKKLSSKD
jgi:pimeloyl-ACP methyl ester carboxylesterase